MFRPRSLSNLEAISRYCWPTFVNLPPYDTLRGPPEPTRDAISPLEQMDKRWNKKEVARPDAYHVRKGAKPSGKIARTSFVKCQWQSKLCFGAEVAARYALRPRSRKTDLPWFRASSPSWYVSVCSNDNVSQKSEIEQQKEVDLLEQRNEVFGPPAGVLKSLLPFVVVRSATPSVHRD